MKDYISNAKEGLGVIKEALIILVILMVIIWPDRVGGWLARHGLKQIEYGGAVIPLDQFTQTRETLNVVNQAAAAADQPAVKSTLEAASRQLEANLAQQVRSISAKDPASLPQNGWLYLGTINADRTAWRTDVGHSVRSDWPIKPDDTAVLSTDVNMRADSATEGRARARILSVLPRGTIVRILQIDPNRPVPDGDPAAPGFRVWAKVEIVTAG